MSIEIIFRGPSNPNWSPELLNPVKEAMLQLMRAAAFIGVKDLRAKGKIVIRINSRPSLGTECAIIQVR